MTTPSIETPRVYESLRQVGIGLGSIPKTGRMQFGNTSYEYLRADDVQEKISPLLAENNLIVKSDYTVDTLMRGRGEGAPYVYVNLRLTYISTEDGSEFAVTGVGESAATDDKSINKALTQAIKNSHRVTFQFASGEKEPDDLPPRVETDDKPTPAQRKIENARASAAKPVDDALETLKNEFKAAGVARKMPPTGPGNYMEFGDAIAKREAQKYGVTIKERNDWTSNADLIREGIKALKAGEVI